MKNFGWFATLAFAIAAALRLARFNVMAERPDAARLASAILRRHALASGSGDGAAAAYLHLSALELPASKAFAPFFIVYVLAIAFLMASPIPHFSGKKMGRVPRDLIIPLLFCVVVLLLLLWTYPMEILILLSSSYLLRSPSPSDVTNPCRGRKKRSAESS